MDSLNNYTTEQLEQIVLAINEKILLAKKTEEEANKHIEKKPTDKIVCKICKGKYTRSNKAKHEKTARHKREVEFTNTLRNLAKSKTIMGRT
jgi:hypothetical protein